MRWATAFHSGVASLTIFGQVSGLKAYFPDWVGGDGWWWGCFWALGESSGEEGDDERESIV